MAQVCPAQTSASFGDDEAVAPRGSSGEAPEPGPSPPAAAPAPTMAETPLPAGPPSAAPGAAAGFAASAEPRAMDHGAVFRAFAEYARAARLERYVSGSVGVVAGGTLLGVGIVAKDVQDPLADFWLVMGGVSLGLSALSFVFPSAPEMIAQRHGVGGIEQPTQEQAASLELAWQSHADKARTARISSGFISLILAGVSIGVGTAIALGEFEFSSESERTIVSALLIGAGATAAVGSVASFVVPSAAERSFRTYRATVGERSPSARGPGFSLAVTGAPAGWGLGLRGAF